jgi:hypothetical protein
MDDCFEKLLNLDQIRIATKHNVIVSLDIEKLNKPNAYSIDCLYKSAELMNYDIEKVLFQINSYDGELIINPTELKQKLYKELNKVRRCNRCSKVYMNDKIITDHILNCQECELELDYIETESDKNDSYECGLCHQKYWSYFGKKSSCCNSPRLCFVCCSKIISYGFCCYCKRPVDETDYT